MRKPLLLLFVAIVLSGCKHLEENATPRPPTPEEVTTNLGKYLSTEPVTGTYLHYGTRAFDDQAKFLKYTCTQARELAISNVVGVTNHPVTRNCPMLVSKEYVFPAETDTKTISKSGWYVNGNTGKIVYRKIPGRVSVPVYFIGTKGYEAKAHWFKYHSSKEAESLDRVSYGSCILPPHYVPKPSKHEYPVIVGDFYFQPRSELFGEPYPSSGFYVNGNTGNAIRKDLDDSAFTSASMLDNGYVPEAPAILIGTPEYENLIAKLPFTPIEAQGVIEENSVASAWNSAKHYAIIQSWYLFSDEVSAEKGASRSGYYVSAITGEVFHRKFPGYITLPSLKYPGTASFRDQLSSLKVKPKEAEQIAAKSYGVINSDKPKAPPFGNKLTLLLGKWYIFSDSTIDSGVSKKGYYVNGETGTCAYISAPGYFPKPLTDGK